MEVSTWLLKKLGKRAFLLYSTMNRIYFKQTLTSKLHSKDKKIYVYFAVLIFNMRGMCVYHPTFVYILTFRV